MSTYHEPVMLMPCIDFLNIKEGGIYVDVTFGGGGHSRAILEKLGAGGKLFGFDQDEDALNNRLDDPRFEFVQANFGEIVSFLRFYGIKKVDGILADLGVSSFQLDEASRGFSYRFEAPLDMRMNKSAALDAAKVINTYSDVKLLQMFSEYGEVRNSKTLVQHIVKERRLNKVHTIQEFIRMIDPVLIGDKFKYWAQVFQAIRIEVNNEMGVLKDFLMATRDLLNPGGRLVVMSYHSLEDRLVKNYLKAGNVEGAYESDFYGNIDRPFEVLTKKAIVASPAEVKRNPRARSAKLRAGEKV
jgi:16S rRNA (cytosine1402-N4)-methyltransferase